MEIHAIALLGCARPNRIAVTPSGTGLVVAHSGQNIVVNSPSLCERLLDPSCFLCGKLRDLSLEGHETVRLKKALEISWNGRGRIVCELLIVQGSAVLASRHVKTHADLRQSICLRGWHLKVQEFVAVFCLTMPYVGQR